MLAFLWIVMMIPASAVAVTREIDAGEREPNAQNVARVYLQAVLWPVWLVAELGASASARLLPPGEGV